MHENDLSTLLRQVAAGTVTPDEASVRLKTAPAEAALNGVMVDHHRALRTGLGEAVLALGKSDDRLLTAVSHLGQSEGGVLVTRISPEQGALLSRHFPDGTLVQDAGLFCLGKSLPLAPPYPHTGEVLVVTAGASDMAVGLEALGTALFYGLDAGLVSDVGVAGLHRIAPHLPALHAAKVLIVVAGMEGALPSVVAGLCGRPVIGVPTSVGYGAGAGGITPLFAMLNSCAAGISVVNIDNGYGAAVFAAKLCNTFRSE